uniref:HIG1 domain-containing protein n=1 Tax=Globisporangium ultimum (strain ATCC 200006 / CBS 805.95 / DAOM BR144) TaxID=431595 RepID=K3XBJ6_GLOUD
MREDFSWMNETPGKKTFWQRAQEDPLVPLGCAVTLAVLVGGLATFQRGQSKLGNKFMQARVVAQTATVLAMGGGALMAATKKEEEKKQSYEERLNIRLRGDDATK